MTSVVFQVIPLSGIGPVLLGMSREEVQAAMGEEPYRFKKLFWSSNLTEAYHKGAFQVFFDEADKVEFIELSSPGASFAVEYKGVNVFQTRADDLIAFISRDVGCDPQQPEPGYTFVFSQIGLSLWRELVPENDSDPEGQYFNTVGIGTQHYIKTLIITPFSTNQGR